MSISSIFSALNTSSYAQASTAAAAKTSQFQQQLAVSSTDPTTTVANAQSTTGATSTSIGAVKGKGGHHHHHAASGSDQVDSQSILDQLSQAFGEDDANDVTAADGNVDLSKLSTLLGSKSQTQTSTLTNPLLSITA